MIPFGSLHSVVSHLKRMLQKHDRVEHLGWAIAILACDGIHTELQNNLPGDRGLSIITPMMMLTAW